MTNKKELRDILEILEYNGKPLTWRTYTSANLDRKIDILEDILSKTREECVTQELERLYDKWMETLSTEKIEEVA